MHLDMLTMSAVSFTVTSILGIVLIFAWARAGATSFVGWWGLALILQSAGIAIAATSSFHSGDILTLGQATMVLADAVKWHASRQFAHRKADVFWTFAGPLGFLLAAHSGLVSGFDDRLILLCTLMALYNFAAAVEMSYANGERLVSRWPAVALLAFTGAGYLSWLPLIIVRPIESASAVFSSSWFPVVILVTLLLRIALAFIVLSMAKERQELERRADALTDALTGLPNRRALFEAADSLTQSRNGSAGPVSVLLFDLDHFKETNDTFGHEVGDPC
jgi:predicted signal transduction protein with EAL and GGDEF domain